ncbi:DNA-binding MarR family transcriptional regulator [Streptomyces aurantiacus]|uniref:MarR family winged helix-turn-helix transcriptional regulator n=1 Tax=Streptomyces aurantiacus TaxID=47760 RepID=UPI002790B4A3|nr:MarR family winged helix-turn-helix transcriptional regulator [Streptomyces aurantiacus]MDQ0779048.1 DNA-binding MarR family transcriptional regulator [Streptomyces aurantiacus]
MSDQGWNVIRECNVTAIRKASRRLTQLYDEALRPVGLRSTQYSVLAELTANAGNPPTMRQLADSLIMDRSALGHAVRPLVRDGLLALEEGQADRRSRLISVTPKGRNLFRRAQLSWQEVQDYVAAAMGDEQAENLRTVMLAVAGNDRLRSLSN